MLGVICYADYATYCTSGKTKEIVKIKLENATANCLKANNDKYVIMELMVKQKHGQLGESDTVIEVPDTDKLLEPVQNTKLLGCFISDNSCGQIT